MRYFDGGHRGPFAKPFAMRLAVCTTAFDRALAAGDLTQLELIELCARKFGVDGIVLDIAHFPRRDDEYVAQLKKLAADLALTIAAVRDDALTSRNSDALDIAGGLGAPYVLTRMPESGTDPVTAYNAALASLAHAAAEAKRVNVTMALRNVPGSLAADAFELGRVRKEADTAWLRFAVDVDALEESPDEKLRKQIVVAYASQASSKTRLLAALPNFPGFVCLDDENPVRIDAWRAALARQVLGTGVAASVADPHVPS